MEVLAARMSEEDLGVVRRWGRSGAGAALMLHTPAYGDVGEEELVEELARARYEANVAAGAHFRDSFSRHFASRSIPPLALSGGPLLSEFLDCLEERAGVTSEFIGVDAIDLTLAVGRRLEGAPAWERLLAHVRSHKQAGFVFVVKGGTAGEAARLADSIQLGAGIAVEVVELLELSEEFMADLLLEASGGALGCRGDAERICSELRRLGRPMSYATAREAVAKASLRPHAAGGIPGRFIARGETRIGF